MTQLKIMASSGMVVFILVFGLATSPAFSMHVMCGGTIFVDTDLDSNLIGCTGNGITIGADDIKLRLKGFIIDGTGVGSGILLMDRVRVKIKGPGVVREFFEGILLDRGNNNEIKDLVVADNDPISGGRGIHTLNSSNNKIKGSTVYGNGFTGIQISGGSGNKVEKNDAHGNTTGIFLSGSGHKASGNNSHGNSIRGITVAGDNNRIEKNQISQQNTGIAINPGADGNIVRRNNITDNGGAGVLIQDANNNEIRENVITNSFSGGVSILSGTGTVVERNTFSNNADQIFDGGSGTVVVDNICDPPDADPVCN